MKKSLALILALALCLILTACVALPAASDTVSPTAEAPASTAAPTTKAPETQAPTTQAPETQAPTTQAPETQAPEPAAELSKGAVNGNIYTNKSLNLRFDLPSGWSFYSEEEIAEVNNMTQEKYENTDVADAVAESGQYMDLFAASATNLDNVNLIIQPANALLNVLTEQQIFEALEDTYRTQFPSAGMEIKNYEILTAKFCGEDKTVLHMEILMSGITMQEYQLWIRSNPDYTAVLTVSSTSIQDPQTILNYFSALK